MLISIIISSRDAYLRLAKLTHNLVASTRKAADIVSVEIFWSFSSPVHNLYECVASLSKHSSKIRLKSKGHAASLSTPLGLETTDF